MKELKSKKIGRVETISDEEYNEIVIADRERQIKLLDKFTVTDIRVRNIIPSSRPVVPQLKEIKPENVEIKEVKPKIKRHEG